jgi:hypothetical protein
MPRKRCPENTFCVSNALLYIIVIIIVIIIISIYNNKKKNQNMLQAIIESNQQLFMSFKDTVSSVFNLNLSTVSFNKRLTDPLEPPERTTPLFFRRMAVTPTANIRLSEQTNLGIPVNVHTRGEAVHYQQVGVLIQDGASGDNKKILPIYGKPTYSGSQNWNYYTSTDGYHSMKVSITNNNKSCTHEFGCKELYDGDLVKIEGYDSQFKVSLYELDKPRYIPYVV